MTNSTTSYNRWRWWATSITLLCATVVTQAGLAQTGTVDSWVQYSVEGAALQVEFLPASGSEPEILWRGPASVYLTPEEAVKLEARPDLPNFADSDALVGESKLIIRHKHSDSNWGSTTTYTYQLYHSDGQLIIKAGSVFLHVHKAERLSPVADLATLMRIEFARACGEINQ